jgi:hypothetical protein
MRREHPRICYGGVDLMSCFKGANNWLIYPLSIYGLSANFLTFKDPKNRFQETNSAMLCSPADRCDNSIPTRFLAPIDCLKIPAVDSPRVQFYPEGRYVRRKKCWKFLHQLVT